MSMKFYRFYQYECRTLVYLHFGNLRRDRIKMGKVRIQWIDIARALAMLSVIVGHSLYVDMGQGMFTGTASVKGFIELFGRMIYAFHMPIFFILSGYLFRKKSYSREAKGALWNLILPYLTTCGLMIVLELITNRLSIFFLKPYLSSFRDTFVASLYGVGLKPTMPISLNVAPIGAIWFLPAMAIAVQIFNLVITKTEHSTYKSANRIFLLLVLALIGKLVSSYWLLPFSINAALFSLIFLYIGYLFKEEDYLKNISSMAITLGIFVWVLDAFGQTFLLVSVSFPDTLLAIVGAVGASLVVFKIAQFLDRGNWISNGLAFIGRNSIIILCFHIVDLNYSRIPDMLIHQQVLRNGMLQIAMINVYRVDCKINPNAVRTKKISFL